MKTKLTLAACVVVASGLLAVAVDALAGTKAELQATVKDKQYRPATIQFYSDGSSTTTEASWRLVLQADTSRTAVNVSSGMYETVKIGDTVTVTGRFGRLSKHFYGFTVTP